MQVPDHLVLLQQGQELCPPGVIQLLVVEVETHGEQRVFSRWGQRNKDIEPNSLRISEAREPAGGATPSSSARPAAFPFFSACALQPPEVKMAEDRGRPQPLAPLAQANLGHRAERGRSSRGRTHHLASCTRLCGHLLPGRRWGPALASRSPGFSSAQARVGWEWVACGPGTAWRPQPGARDWQSVWCSGNFLPARLANLSL